MPREMILRCDAPGCDEIGRECYVEVEGRRYEVILGSRHRPSLGEIAEWGRPVEATTQPARASRRRGSDEARLLALLDADLPDGSRP